MEKRIYSNTEIDSPLQKKNVENRSTYSYA